jgi:hypothetical protein
MFNHVHYQCLTLTPLVLVRIQVPQPATCPKPTLTKLVRISPDISGV